MSGFSSNAPGGPPPHSDLRIVLLGKAGAGKSRITKAILKDTKLKEESEECVLYEGEHAERKICIVDTPGWDRISAECTTKKIKNEITRSVTLCPPGPSALILVFPVNTGDELSLNDFESASQHMELLSERVWNHTMVLFLCAGDLEESTVKKHIHTSAKLLEKCQGRHYVMRQTECETQVDGLLKKIESMVEEKREFLPPQVPDEVKQNKKAEDTYTTTNIKQAAEKSKVEEGLRQRRGSCEGNRPHMTQQAEDSADKPKTQPKDQLPWEYIKPVVVILMSFMGALIGSVAGAPYGTVGAVLGIVVGFVVLMLLSLLLLHVIA